MSAEITIAANSMWRNTTYLKLLSAQIISLAGTGISTLCLALLAWELEGEDASVVLGIAFALKMIAYVGLAPIFGAIAHKLPRKIFMFGLDITRAGLLLCLPFVTQTWQVYILMFLINACSAGFTPLFQSTLPQVLTDKTQYTKALSYSRLAYDLEQLISPLLTATLLFMITFRELFVLDSITFLISATLILLCQFPTQPVKTNNKQGWKNLKFGIQSYLTTPKLEALWFAYLAAACASAMVIVNTVVYVQNILGGGESETALAMAFVGFGSMIIAFKLPKWLHVFSIRQCILMGGSAISLALFIGVLTPGWVGFIGICLLLGAGMSFIQTPAGLIITQSCSEQDTAEYFSAHFSLTHFWWFFTYLIAGWSNKELGLPNTYLLMAIVCIFSLYTALKLYPRSE